MAFQVIFRNRATQDIRQQANYILVNSNRESAEKFLEFVEYAFAQLAITPNMGKVVSSFVIRIISARTATFNEQQHYQGRKL
ncbi:hypothetical protein B6N60_04393 [Richelia sinica FACHB-800]|uniref:Type II toxin-antitoxin system RelE/ParE family toxin n=1 Tax=Richelia sinica FACHB-800 TaxID=1357546 RepID=A0A975TCT9_9NOST|nr:type II toxin-antitoxin system RelE/ParE family toxin [Richelia sinica]QXE25673.1 hypothetical protein B6N60_04393 [Richelia sinica FACHB-800]